MKTKNLLVATFMTIGVILISSCAKDGATGPAGPAGANGTNGTNGTNGMDGTDGNANVESSSITSSSWVYTAPSWKVTFTYASITQDIIDNGAVLVYNKVGASYNQLPLTYYPSATYSSTYEVSTVVGGLSIFVTDSDLSQPANPGSQTFKVVVIAASGLIAHPDVDFKNYEQVKSAFNLND